MSILEIILRTPTHLLNFLTGGSIKHSFSARVGKVANERGSKWAMIAQTIINMLLWFHDDHCYKEYINEFKGY